MRDIGGLVWKETREHEIIKLTFKSYVALGRLTEMKKGNIVMMKGYDILIILQVHGGIEKSERDFLLEKNWKKLS